MVQDQEVMEKLKLKKMNKVKLTIKTITPLIIKSAEGFSAVEFFLGKENFYHFDIKKILQSEFAEIFKQVIDKQVESLSKEKDIPKFIELQNFYRENVFKLNRFILETIPLSPNVDWSNVKTVNIIKFIRYFDWDLKKEVPFIPGSSVKGAFLEAYFQEFRIFKINLKKNIGEYIGFTDFYFKSFKNRIEKLTRYNIRKNKTEVSYYVELVEGEAEGELFFPVRDIKDYQIQELKNQNLTKQKTLELLEKKSEYYQKKRQRFMPYFSQEFRQKIRSEEGFVMPLGFGSGSYQKPGSQPVTYTSFNQQRPYDPVGVVVLKKI